MSSDTLNVLNWTEDDVAQYLKREQISDIKFLECIHDERVDGKSLLALSERDVRDLKLKYSNLRLGDLKHFWIAVRQLQKENQTNLVNLGLVEQSQTAFGGYVNQHHQQQQHSHAHHHHHHFSCCSDISGFHDMERISPPLSIDGRATSIKPEIFKTMISLGESCLCVCVCLFLFPCRLKTKYEQPYEFFESVAKTIGYPQRNPNRLASDFKTKAIKLPTNMIDMCFKSC